MLTTVPAEMPEGFQPVRVILRYLSERPGWQGKLEDTVTSWGREIVEGTSEGPIRMLAYLTLSSQQMIGNKFEFKMAALAALASVGIDERRL